MVLSRVSTYFNYFRSSDVTSYKIGLKDSYINGDLGFDPLGLGGKNSKDTQTKELNNGRLAMIAVAGIVAQELATGTSAL